MNLDKPSQNKKILNLFELSEWVCSNQMRDLSIGYPASRIYGLKKKGFIFTERICTRHNHEGNISEYKLISEPQPANPPKAERNTTGKGTVPRTTHLPLPSPELQRFLSLH